MSKYMHSGRPQSSRCKRTTRPRLEALENRLVLSSTVLPTVSSPAPFAGAGTGTNSAIVEGLYHNILGRAADSAGLASWTAQLNAGESRRSGRRSVLPVNRVHDRCGRVLLHDLSRPRRRYGGGRILGGHAPGGRERGAGRGSVPLLARVHAPRTSLTAPLCNRSTRTSSAARRSGGDQQLDPGPRSRDEPGCGRG